MGYRIDYQPLRKVRKREIYHTRRAALTALCFLLFLVLVNSIWPEGAQTLKKMLFSVRDTVEASALNTFAENLDKGNSLPDAFRTFFQNLIQERSLAAG